MKEFIKLLKFLIYIADSRNLQNVINSNSVHLIVQSPPYFDIKDYGVNSQIGFGQRYSEYINSLNKVWDESYRILKEGCRMCVVVGDQYLSKKKYGRYRIKSIKSNIIQYCSKIGFDFMGNIIWRKIATSNPSGGCSFGMGSYLSPRNPIISYDFEYILLFRKPKRNNSNLQVSDERKESSRLTKKEWKEYVKGGVWKVKGAHQGEHPATFPLEIPKRLIKLFSFKGETVADLFLGSGTTLKASRILDRNGIGVELNKNYLNLIKKKVSLLNDDSGGYQKRLNRETSIKIKDIL